MIISGNTISKQQFEAASGWEIKPEGACKGDVCIPLGEMPGEDIDVAWLADKMSLPLVSDSAHNMIAMGPESTMGRTLTTAVAPELELPDLDGNLFKLSSLKGQKIIVYAWAPY